MEYENAKEEVFIQLVSRLIGDITPAGETYEDEERLKNLQMCSIVLHLIINDLYENIIYYKNDTRGSVKRIVSESYKILESLNDYMDILERKGE